MFQVYTCQLGVLWVWFPRGSPVWLGFCWKQSDQRWAGTQGGGDGSEWLHARHGDTMMFSIGCCFCSWSFENMCLMCLLSTTLAYIWLIFSHPIINEVCCNLFSLVSSGERTPHNYGVHSHHVTAKEVEADNSSHGSREWNCKIFTEKTPSIPHTMEILIYLIFLPSWNKQLAPEDWWLEDKPFLLDTFGIRPTFFPGANLLLVSGTVHAFLVWKPKSLVTWSPFYIFYIFSDRCQP